MNADDGVNEIIIIILNKNGKATKELREDKNRYF
jgi:hypothetical protein